MLLRLKVGRLVWFLGRKVGYHQLRFIPFNTFSGVRSVIADNSLVGSDRRASSSVNSIVSKNTDADGLRFGFSIN